MSLLPLHWGSSFITHIDGMHTINERFINNPPIDSDLPIIRANWVQSVASNIRRMARLDDWVRLSNNTQLTLGANFLDLDEFWLEALVEANNAFVKEQNDNNSRTIQDMKNNLDLQPYRSPLDLAPMPKFHG